MIAFLARKFIPNYDDFSSASVRTAYGILAGGMGIALNVLLFLGKFIAGMLSGSIAATADAINNLSDAGSSVITLIGFKLSSKKPDPDHPFGHGRIEYLTGLAVSLVILLMGFELFKTSIEKIISPEPVQFNVLSFVILASSILIKLYMSLYNGSLARKLSSPAMEATASDCRSDMLATIAVLVSMLISHFTGFSIDGWAGLLVSLAILWSGYGAARDTINPLLGQAPDAEFVDSVRRTVLSGPNVLGIHDMIIHDYGPGRRMVSLHAEVPANGDILALHDEIDQLEHLLKEEMGCDAVIHMDPIVTEDERLMPMLDKISDLLQAQIDPNLQLHDFRMVTGPTHTNLIFDAVAPYNFRLTDEQLRHAIAETIHTFDETLFAVVTIDHGYAQ